MNGDNGLIYALCTILLILTSRLLRAALMILMMGVAFSMLQGSLTSQKALTLVIGVFLIVAPAKIAASILPSKITNVSGNLGTKVFDKNKSYSPEEIISASCPGI